MPQNSNEMLMGMYPWAQDNNYVVVISVNAELKALKKGEMAATQADASRQVESRAL
jgi:hypothetical protein